MNVNEIMSLVEDLTYRVRILERKVAELVSAAAGAQSASADNE